ncbi:AraC family transcriptional regulator [Deminuibacter soli]|uniref:AraC family transcriptional regulator n=1 Tax=Deminuibacter soli TaxID=2291815 RepID=A0A3E1ND64_9BACT|nr:helix-turn-helix domain-containing protein [Deminuibacter soli]RFM25781.1 AraC family transcriptional regulator [Deminuibacter soli]
MNHYKQEDFLNPRNGNDAMPFLISPLNAASIIELAILTGREKVEITWLTKGTGELKKGGELLSLHAGQLLVTKQEKPHTIQLSPDAEGFYITFTEDFPYTNEYEFDLMDHVGLTQLFAERNAIDVLYDMHTSMQNTATCMLAEQRGQYLHKATLLRRYLKIFILQVMRNLQGKVNLSLHTREKELTSKFLDLVSTNFKNKKLVTDYADKMLITPNHLNSVVKKITGRTASFHIRQRVILEAKRHAVQQGLRMKEIAWHLGFSDTSHFSKYFKSITGISFSDFMKEGTETILTIPDTALYYGPTAVS